MEACTLLSRSRDTSLNIRTACCFQAVENLHESLMDTSNIFARISPIPFEFLAIVSLSSTGRSLLFPDGSPTRAVAPPSNATGIWPHLHGRISTSSPQHDHNRMLQLLKTLISRGNYTRNPCTPQYFCQHRCQCSLAFHPVKETVNLQPPLSMDFETQSQLPYSNPQTSALNPRTLPTLLQHERKKRKRGLP